MNTNSSEPAQAAWRKWAARDHSWAQAMHRSSERLLVFRVLKSVSWLSDGILWYGTVLLLPWIGGASGTACALRLLVLGSVNLTIYAVTKRHFARPRPFVTCQGVSARARSLDEHSFPSGHVIHAVSFGIVLSTYYAGLEWIVWPFAVLVALSRVVLGLHYPSDVLVGALIGAGSARLILMLF